MTNLPTPPIRVSYEQRQDARRAIRDGIVLDHIPAEKLFKIVALLRLDTLTTPVTIGNNLMSARHKRKGIIKMADHFVSSQEIDKIALLAPRFI